MNKERNKSLKMKTPIPLSQDVLEFMRSISKEKHTFLKTKSSHPKFLPNFCFENVLDKCKVDGGTPLYGWAIWKNQLMVEAEFHCVWVSPNGKKIVDVTPQTDGSKRLVFLPDPSMIYQGITVPNIRVPLVNSPSLKNYIDCITELEKFKSSIMEPYSYMLKCSGEESVKYKDLESKLQSANSELIENLSLEYL